jgi:hypothetical protein
MRHRTIRISFQRLLEAADRFLVVEAEAPSASDEPA